MKFAIRNSAYTSYFDRNLITKNAPTESCCCCAREPSGSRVFKSRKSFLIDQKMNFEKPEKPHS